MKQLMTIFTLLMTTTLLSSNAYAATTEITWKDYEKYYDVNEGNHSRANFKDLLTGHLEEHLTELAAKLPENQTLKIEVTDVDLAGQVRPGAMNSSRIVKNGYPPRINFSYQLLDANGKEIKSEELKLRDLSFMTNPPMKYRNKLFGYEKKMLDDWFKDTFSDLITK